MYWYVWTRFWRVQWYQKIKRNTFWGCTMLSLYFHIFIYIYIYMCVCVCRYIYIYIYIYIYTERECVWRKSIFENFFHLYIFIYLFPLFIYIDIILKSRCLHGFFWLSPFVRYFPSLPAGLLHTYTYIYDIY